MGKDRRLKRKIKRKYDKFDSSKNGLIDATCTNINDVMESCRRQAAKFGVKYIPADYLKILFSQCKLNVHTSEDWANKHNKWYNTFLDKTLATLIDISSNMDTKNIPVDNIKMALDELKEVYNNMRD
jgi:hypothetical protein